MKASREPSIGIDPVCCVTLPGPKRTPSLKRLQAHNRNSVFLIITLGGLLGAPHNWFWGLIVIFFGGAVWIRIRQLDFAELFSASRLPLGGKFRQIIDDETRMADFE